MNHISHQRSRSYGIALSSLIFLTAIGAVTLLARAPFGEIYGTLLGGAGNTRTASITLYGTTKPKVEMSVAEKEGAQYIILAIEDMAPLDTLRSGGATPAFAKASAGRQGDTQTITLTIPKSWHLEEVRGAHASDIASYSASERTTLMIPMVEGNVELRFTTNETFEAVAFTHDASSPALFTIIRLTLPYGVSEKKSEIVEESTIFPLL